MDIFGTHPIRSEPLKEFTKFYTAARNTESMWPHNFVLVTVDSEDQPHGRTVSLHTHDERGFCFCSNYDGPKSQQIAHNPRGAMVFAWEGICVQVRITGTITKLSPQESDILFNKCRRSEKTYYLSCSQGKDHPFSQSAVITDMKDYKKYKSDCNSQYSEGDLQRPPSWGGWRVSPRTIEIMDMKATPCRRKWTLQDDGNWTLAYLAD